MATPMGPPTVLGYSLRVQLYSHAAHALEDKPIRCFRVMTSPDVTVREFCQEASRIHEINYGHPLVIKKVQDDQEFDITQNEVLGGLFPTMSTIRMVQASTNPATRDSIPPTSALRFEPNVNPLKRARQESVDATGSIGPWKPEKRQKVFDPDRPLPSREEAPQNTYQQELTTPHSQESVILGGGARSARPPRIPETPDPPPLRALPHFEETTSDAHAGKAATLSQIHLSNSRAKSASYHIPRTTDRGHSTSTDATSPQSTESRRLTQNGTTPILKQPSPPGNAHRALNEDSIYDVVSDEEPVVKPRLVSQRARISPNGLPGLQWAKDRSGNTPPSGPRRSASREQAITPGELPLTPNSKERELKRRQQGEAAKNARVAAAEAAKHRQREAQEARLAEEEEAARRARAEREEQERLEIEEFNQAEAERRAKAEQMKKTKKEQEEREEKLAQEAEQKRVAKIEQERRRREALAAIAKAEEAKRQQEEAQAEKKRSQKSKSKSRELESPVPDHERASKSTSPILPKSRLGSSTPFIPRGKPTPQKSCLKSSQAIKSSSPVRPSSSGSNSGEILEGHPVPLQSPRARTVSFAEKPISSSSTSLPPRATSSNTPAKTLAITPQESLGKPQHKTATDLRTTAILPPGRNTTPILPPSTAKRQLAERSASPVKAAPAIKPSTVKKGVEPSKLPAVKTTPIHPPTRIVPGSRIVPGMRIAPPAKPIPAKSISPVESQATNVKSRPAKQAQAPAEESSESEEEDEDAEETDDEESEISDVDMITEASRPTQATTSEDSESEDEEEDVESDADMEDPPAQVQRAAEDRSESEEEEAQAPEVDAEMDDATLERDQRDPVPEEGSTLPENVPLPGSNPSEDESESDDDEHDLVMKSNGVLQNPFSGKDEAVGEPDIDSRETSSAKAQDIEQPEESEDEDPDATQSQNSSPPPDDRSPILYHQNTSRAMESRLRRIPMLDGSSSFPGTNRTIKLEPNSDDDEEPTPKAQPSTDQPIEISDNSESSDEDEDVQVPRSFLASQQSVKPSPRPSPSLRQSSTQSQVNYQLSSSFGRQNSTPVARPSSQAQARPASQYRSLSSLSGKNLVGSSQSKAVAQPVMNGTRNRDDENSQSESEDNSTESSSDDDEEEQQELSLPILPVEPSTPRRRFMLEDDSDAESNSDNSESEKAEEERLRLEKLKINIAAMQRGGNNSSYATVNGGGRSTGKKVGSASASKADAKREAKSEKAKKYLTGYSFSQPGIGHGR